MKSVKIFLLAISVFIFAFSSLVYAEVPQMINYQGKITKPSGALIDTTVGMVFSIYSDSTGGTTLWTEPQTVKVEYGVYSVLLGSVNPIPDSVFNGSVRYLGLKVGDDQEMTPRKAMVSVGYAYHSVTADTAHFAMPDADWTINGDTIYHLNGNVGIGTNTPSPFAKLDIIMSSSEDFPVGVQSTVQGHNSVGVVGAGMPSHSSGGDATGVKGGAVASPNSVGNNIYGGYFLTLPISSAKNYYGVYAWGNGPSNEATYGVYAKAMGSNVVNYGIYAEVPEGDSGFAGYFQGEKSYFSGNVGIGTIDTDDYKLYVKGKNKGIYAVATEGATLTTTSGETPFDVAAQPPDGRPYAVVADVNTPNSVLTGGGYYTKLFTANAPNVSYLYGANFNVDDNDLSGNPHEIRAIHAGLLNTGADDYAVEITANDPSYAIYTNGDGKVYFSGKVGIGTTSPERALHISDVMRLQPRASAPSNPSEGDIYVDSTDHHIYCYLNGVWKQLDN